MKVTQRELDLRAMREARVSSRGGGESRPATKAAVGEGEHPTATYGRTAQAKNGPLGARVLGAGTSDRLSGRTVPEPSVDSRDGDKGQGRDKSRAGVASGPREATGFDRKAYQRDYMRRWRAKQPKREGKSK